MGILKFVKGKNRSLAGLNKLINYITKDEKTDICLIYGKDVNPDTAYYEMLQTKIDFNKKTGLQYKHLIQSFATYDDITPEIAYEIGKEFLKHPLFDGFQVLMAVHRDKEHVHIHYAINSVNSETGKKWNQKDSDLDSLRQLNDKLCRQHNLTVIPPREKGENISDGEYRNTKQGASWKHELWLTVRESMRHSDSRAHFISNMERLGYKVNWSDSRKYITFTTPTGMKCRNNKLYPPENFTKEKLEETFSLNARYANKEELGDEFDLIASAVFLLQAGNQDEKSRRYPLSHMEGEAFEEYIAEAAKGSGLDMEDEKGYDR